MSSTNTGNRNNQRTKKRNPNNNKKRYQRINAQQRQDQYYDSLNISKIPRNLGGNAPFPAFQKRKLTYTYPSLVVAGATPFLIREFRINSVFDPDPLASTGVPAGYAAMAMIYGQYRVEHFSVRLEVSSNEPALSQVVGLTFKDEQPSTVILTYRDAQDTLEVAPSTQPQILGQTGGTSVWRSPWYHIHPGTITGNQLGYMADNDYSAVTGANPAQIVWLAFIAYGPTSGGTLPNGCIVNLFMEFTTRFYGPRAKLDTLLYEQLNSRRDRRASLQNVKQKNLI